jgi:hypothetical protein
VDEVLADEDLRLAVRQLLSRVTLPNLLKQARSHAGSLGAPDRLVY